MTTETTDMISFLGNAKTISASAVATMLLAFQETLEWTKIDSWAEFGIVVGTAVTLFNFCLGLYDRFWRKKHEANK